MNARSILLPAIALLGAGALWWTNRDPFPTDTPAATWRAGDSSDFEQGRAFHELPAGTPIRLSFHCSEPRHVYVFSRSAEDGTLLLFPSPDVHSDVANPLEPGRTVLPGSNDDEALAWNSRSQILATTTFVVIAADRALPELDELATRLRRWTNRARTDGSMVVTNPAAGVAVAGTARQDWPHPLLARAAMRGAAATEVNGPLTPDPKLPGVWTGSWNIRERPGTAADVPQPLPLIPRKPGADDK